MPELIKHRCFRETPAAQAFLKSVREEYISRKDINLFSVLLYEENTRLIEQKVTSIEILTVSNDLTSYLRDKDIGLRIYSAVSPFVAKGRQPYPLMIKETFKRSQSQDLHYFGRNIFINIYELVLFISYVDTRELDSLFRYRFHFFQLLIAAQLTVNGLKMRIVRSQLEFYGKTHNDCHFCRFQHYRWF